MWVICAKCGKDFVSHYGTDTNTEFVCKDCRKKHKIKEPR